MKIDLEALEYDFWERVGICTNEGQLDDVRGFSVAWKQITKQMEGLTKLEKENLYKKWKGQING